MRRGPHRGGTGTRVHILRRAAPRELRPHATRVHQKAEGFDERYSFCCAQEGCRRCTTPPSLRFLGPKGYLGAVVTLVTALRCGSNERRSCERRRRVGASRRTLDRWRLWWQELLPVTPFFRAARARIFEVSVAQLPVERRERELLPPGLRRPRGLRCCFGT